MTRTFGENLRRVRKRQRLTQEDLMARLGLRRPGPISLWESRAGLPRAETVARLAKALGCEPRELLEGVETPYDRLLRGDSFIEPAGGALEQQTGGRRRARSA